MIEMNVRVIAEITGGDILQNGASVEISGFSTDSRSLQAGDLFIPLRGDNFDGHNYLNQAIERGASACLSEEVVAGLPAPVIKVADTLKALGDLAAAVRAHFSGPLVGVTGTSGKTTCKEMLASVLEALGAGHKSAGNFNNMIGVPLTLFGLKPEHQWSVVEMGMSARGEISRLAQMASPQLGIITNVGHGHLESLGGISGVARAKGELFINLPREGVALVNIDDHEVKQLPVANGVRRVTFGGALEADIRAERIGAENGLAVFTLVLAGKGYPVRLPMPGRHNVSNALAAAAAAFELGVAPEAIVAGLESFRPIPGRMELVQLGDDIVILEDSYNANPLSVRAALDAVHDFRPSGRHIAVLGDMLELGAAAAELHQDIGAMAATRVDWLLTLGQHAGETARGALDAGMPQERVIVSADHEQLSTLLKDLVQAGDQLLIKGSRGMRMEQITASLRASHGDVTTVRA